MKRIVLPILLLTISSPAFAMWGWFKKKPAPAAVAPTTEATTISAVEPVKAQGEVKAELQEAPATVSGTGSEAEVTSGLQLPETTIKAISAGLGRLSTEAQFLNALRKGDIEQIKTIVETVDVNNPLKTSFAAPKKAPLAILFESDAPNKLEIAQLLLDKGADKSVLNTFAQGAIADKDEKLVNWLTEQGIIAPAQEVEVVEAQALAPTTAERILLWLPTPEQRPTGEEVEGVSALFEEKESAMQPALRRLEKPLSYGLTRPAPAVAKPVAPAEQIKTPSAQITATPTIFGELETEEFIEPVAVTKVARPLPAVPVAKPAIQPRTRVWPSTPAPQPVEVKVEVIRKAGRPLPATPVTQPVLRRALPTPPVSVETVVPVARPLPALPK